MYLEPNILGTFFTHGILRATDPCYGYHGNPDGLVVELVVEPGDWIATELKAAEGTGEGKALKGMHPYGLTLDAVGRVAELRIHHKDAAGVQVTCPSVPIHGCMGLGVDSGMFGFFDDINFKTEVGVNGPTADPSPHSLWRRVFADGDRSIIPARDPSHKPIGVVTPSGFGDGTYPLYGHLNRAGRWDALRVVFII